MSSPFGISDEEITRAGGDTMSEILTLWGNRITNLIRLEVQKSVGGNFSTGQLEQSVQALPVKQEGNEWSLEFEANKYFKFQDKGVQGAGSRKDKYGHGTKKQWRNKGAGSPFMFTDAKPPVNFSSLDGASLRQWAYQNGANEYVVREAIYRSGIAPKHILKNAITDKLINDLMSAIGKSVGKSVELVLAKEFTDGK